VSHSYPNNNVTTIVFSLSGWRNLAAEGFGSFAALFRSSCANHARGRGALALRLVLGQRFAGRYRRCFGRRLPESGHEQVRERGRGHVTPISLGPHLCDRKFLLLHFLHVISLIQIEPLGQLLVQVGEPQTMSPSRGEVQRRARHSSMRWLKVNTLHSEGI